MATCQTNIFYGASNYAVASEKKHEHVSVYKGLQKTCLCLAVDACSHNAALCTDFV